MADGTPNVFFQRPNLPAYPLALHGTCLGHQHHPYLAPRMPRRCGGDLVGEMFTSTV
jgi:hypothetical protein